MNTAKAATSRIAPRLATPTDLGANATKDIAGALNALLADTFALYLKTNNFHWHISGPHFRDYHLLLDEQSDQIFAMIDIVAEVRLADVPVKVLGLQIKSKSIGQQGVERAGDVFGGIGAEIGRCRKARRNPRGSSFCGIHGNGPRVVPRGAPDHTMPRSLRSCEAKNQDVAPLPEFSAGFFIASSAANVSAARASSSRPSDRNRLARASCILETSGLISMALSTLSSASSWRESFFSARARPK